MQTCEHVCFKQQIVDEEKMTGTICHDLGVTARDEGELREALVWVRRGIDDHVSQMCHDLLWTLDHDELHLSPEERRAHMESEDASDAFFSGYGLHWGQFGFSEDREIAYRRFCVAAEKHHVYAIYWKGYCLNFSNGVTYDATAALQCFEQAAYLGCVDACWYAGNMMKDSDEVAMDMHRAALHFKRGAALGDTDCQDRFEAVMCNRPRGVAPWSRWQPDTDVHSLQLECIHRSQMTMLLLAKRVESLRPMRLMILRFISTRE